MPSPGVSALKTALAAETFLVGDNTVSFESTGQMIGKLAAAIHAGWTSSSPASATTMAAKFSIEFSDYASGDGLVFLNCIASAIDAETASWVSSYNATTGLHAYIVSATAITSAITLCSIVDSPGVTALATAVGDAFNSGFDQAAG